MKRALWIGYAILVLLQALVTFIKVLDADYLYPVQQWLIEYDVCGFMVYFAWLRFKGKNFWSSGGSGQAHLIIVGAPNLVCLLIFYTLFMGCVVAARSAWRKYGKPA